MASTATLNRPTFYQTLVMRPSWMRTVSILVGLLVTLVGSVATGPRLLPFQGHLSLADGRPVPDGSHLVRFALYDAPVGGELVWGGQVHRLSVNDGLVNTMLGTRSSLERVDFGSTLYLEITLDADSSGAIDPADPPLLPRQLVVPVPFAVAAGGMTYQEDGRQEVAGWEALLGGQNPYQGFLEGSRIRPESLPFDRLIGKISEQQLEPGAALANLSEGSIDGGKIAPGAIEGIHLKDDEVGFEKTNRRTVAVEAGVSGVAISEPLSVEFIGRTEGVDVLIPELSVTLETTGRPLRIGFLSRGVTPGLFEVAAADRLSSGNVIVFENEVEVARFAMIHVFAGENGRHLEPASAFSHLYLPETSGVKEYTVKFRMFHGTEFRVHEGVRLYAYELR